MALLLLPWSLSTVDCISPPYHREHSEYQIWSYLHWIPLCIIPPVNALICSYNSWLIKVSVAIFSDTVASESLSRRSGSVAIQTTYTNIICRLNRSDVLWEQNNLVYKYVQSMKQLLFQDNLTKRVATSSLELCRAALGSSISSWLYHFKYAQQHPTCPWSTCKPEP